MTLTVSQVFANSTPAQWLSTILSDAQNLGLPSTAWQSGDPLRTILQICSLQLGKEDAQASAQGQGGLLDFAASGSVVITDLDGSSITVPVTPDPSVPGQNPSATPGFLDFLVASDRGVSRIVGAAASGTLYLVNTTGGSLGTFTAGNFHLSNAGTGATFNNQAGFTYSSSTSFAIASVTYGPPVTINTSAPHGLSTGAVVALFNVGGLVGFVGFQLTPARQPIGFAFITVTGANSFTLNGVTGSGSYSGGGLAYVPQPVNVQADLIGTVGNSAPGQLTSQVTSAPGGYFTNMTAIAGSAYQSNAALVTLAKAKLATLSVAGAKGAYSAFAVLAVLILAGQPVNTAGLVLPSPLPAGMVLDGGSITKSAVLENTALGLTTLVVANASGPVAGCVGLALSGVTPGTPVAVATVSPHGLVTGDYGQINGVIGPASINTQWKITVTGANTLTLNGSSDATPYVAGGQLSGGDLYAVDAIERTYVDPNGCPYTTASATAIAVTPGVSAIYVPAAFVADYKTKIQIALPAFFTNFPLGGVNVDAGLNLLPISAIEGVLYASGQTNGAIYTLSVAGLTLNGSLGDISLGQTGVAVLGSIAGILSAVVGV